MGCAPRGGHGEGRKEEARKEYRVKVWHWDEDGREDYMEFDTMEQAQAFYDSLDGMAEIQRYVEAIHGYEAVLSAISLTQEMPSRPRIRLCIGESVRLSSPAAPSASFSPHSSFLPFIGWRRFFRS